MSSIQIMDEIPKLSKTLAEWCMQAVMYIAYSDRVTNHSEKNIIDDLSTKLGVTVPSDEIVSLAPPPKMNEEEKDYILRMIYLMAWIDGEFCEAERKNIHNCLKLLDINKDRATTADLIIRKSIFVASIIGAIEKIVSSSPIANQLIQSLKLNEDAAMQSLREWRRKI